MQILISSLHSINLFFSLFPSKPGTVQYTGDVQIMEYIGPDVLVKGLLINKHAKEL